jgi:uncharacterized protein
MKKEEYADLIKGLSDKELTFHLFLTQIILLTISVILGMILFNSMAEFVGLFTWNWQIVSVGGTAGLAVVFLDLIFMKVLPSSFYDDGGLNERIFKNKSVIQIAFISAIIAIVEESLFRGVIQTHTGLIISSLIFAVVHYRYLFNWFLFINVVLLSFFIGYIFLLTNNLLVTIFMHFIIDFLLGVTIKIRKKN